MQLNLDIIDEQNPKKFFLETKKSLSYLENGAIHFKKQKKIRNVARVLDFWVFPSLTMIFFILSTIAAICYADIDWLIYVANLNSSSESILQARFWLLVVTFVPLLLFNIPMYFIGIFLLYFTNNMFCALGPCTTYHKFTRSNYSTDGLFFL